MEDRTEKYLDPDNKGIKTDTFLKWWLASE